MGSAGQKSVTSVLVILLSGGVFVVLLCFGMAVTCKSFTETAYSSVAVVLEIGAARLRVLRLFSGPEGREHGQASQGDF